MSQYHIDAVDPAARNTSHALLMELVGSNARVLEVASGNVKLAMSRVVPDLVQKIVKGQDRPHILGEGDQIRHYPYGGDLANGVVACRESPARRGRAAVTIIPW